MFKLFKKLFKGKGADKMVFENPLLCSDEEMKNALALWCDMYEDKAYWLGGSTKSLNLAATISAEISRLVTMQMRVSFDDEQKFMPVKFAVDKLMKNIRRYTEYACAKGGIILKPCVHGDELVIDCVQADSFYPIQFNSNGEITGAVFKEQIYRNNAVFTKLEKHLLLNGRYTIENSAYKSSNPNYLGGEIPLGEVGEWSHLSESLTLDNIKKPLFAYFKMPGANTVNSSSPLGVSVFAGAAELIKEADKQYSRLLWEFESGERAIYMDSAAYRRDERGNPIFPDKRLYRSADTGIDGLFEDWTPTLREESILNGLDAILIRIEDVCGIARGTFSRTDTNAKTATELKLLRQRSYVTVAEIQASLADALRELVYAMCIWSSLYSFTDYGECKISIEFDDSIVADRNREFDERIQLLREGVISSAELRAWYLGENIEKSSEILTEEEVK